MWQDVRYALRGLSKSPGFAAVAVLSLALGIGANTAIFSVLHAVLLNPLPYESPERLVVLHEVATESPSDLAGFSLANYLDVKTRARAFESIGYYTDSYAAAYNVTGIAEPERLRTIVVSAGFFSVLGVKPILGTELQSKWDADLPLFVSHRFWMRHLSGARDVVGRQISLSEQPQTISGVLPAGFRFRRDVDLWRQVTSAFEAKSAHERRPGGRRTPVARLRAGVSIAQAQAEMDVIARQLAIDHPRENAGRGIRVVRLSEHLAGPAAAPIRILYGGVCLVLLIACGNVSGLLLARLWARQREIGMRLALGATRGKLARQFLAESAVVAVPGAAVGLLIAGWLVRAIVRLAPADLPRLDEVAINGPVALFTGLVSLVCAIVLGLAPVAQAGRLQPAAALAQTRTTARGADRVRASLIIAQMALAVVLLVGAGLLVRTYVRLTTVDLGFAPDEVVTLSVATQAPRYFDEWQRVVAFHDDALAQLASVPGVRSSAVTSLIPFDEGRFAETVARVDAPQETRPAEYRFVSPGYFETLRVPLHRGRDFLPSDRVGAERVAILGASTARALFGEANPIGHEVLLRGKTRRRVVGVVADVRLYGPGTDPPLQVYGPYSQADDIFWTGLRFVLRTDGDPATVAAAARRRLLSIDRGLPPYDIQPLTRLLSNALAPTRMYGSLLVAFALVALLLASVGLYGLIAFLVTQRTREFGIRVALGATAADVRVLVGRETAKLVALALAAGGVLAVAGGHLIETLLFGVSSTDWVTFAGVSILLVVIAFAASYTPMRRAMRVDPVLALRAE